ncbi:hypothetical protein LCGC14_2729620, partial [marine sediment metagenome]
MTRTVILGNGGYARVLFDTIGLIFMACRTAVGSDPEVLCTGNDGDLLPGDRIVVGMGDIARRRQVAEKHRGRHQFHPVIHPSATVAANILKVSDVQIMAGAVVQPGVEIGANVLINFGALIDHPRIDVPLPIPINIGLDQELIAFLAAYVLDPFQSCFDSLRILAGCIDAEVSET